MRADWIPIGMNPREPGVYLVTTHKGVVIFDRFDGEGWGRCQPRANGKGRYKNHIAWTLLPRPAKEVGHGRVQ